MFISVSSEIISGSSPDRRIERQTQTAVRQTHSTKRLAISKQSKSLMHCDQIGPQGDRLTAQKDLQLVNSQSLFLH